MVGRLFCFGKVFFGGFPPLVHLTSQRLKNSVRLRPSSASFLRERPPKIGIATTEMAKTTTRHHTIIDYRPDFFMYDCTAIRLKSIPIVDHPAIQRL